jgi:hypothetical protein
MGTVEMSTRTMKVLLWKLNEWLAKLLNVTVIGLVAYGVYWFVSGLTLFVNTPVLK